MKTLFFFVFIFVADSTRASQITVQNLLSDTVHVAGFQTFDLAPGESVSITSLL